MTWNCLKNRGIFPLIVLFQKHLWHIIFVCLNRFLVNIFDSVLGSNVIAILLILDCYWQLLFIHLVAKHKISAVPLPGEIRQVIKIKFFTPFVPNSPFLYPPCIENKWVNQLLIVFDMTNKCLKRQWTNWIKQNIVKDQLSNSLIILLRVKQI